MTAGYSGTPLVKKLGIKAGMAVCAVNTPEGYQDLLAPLPADLQWREPPEYPLDFVHFFSTDRQEFEAQFPLLKAALADTGMLWISWPKKASKVPTDLDENIIREVGLANGLVDVKVAAIDATWSGLKFVYRLKDRA